jgi:hypothetical protein
MTSQFWPIIFNKNNTPENAASEIKYNYLTEVKYFDKNNKEKQQELFLMNDIWQWKKYVLVNKFTQTNLPDNIKFMIPKKFIKNPENSLEKNIKNDFDNKIKTYEKLFDL